MFDRCTELDAAALPALNRLPPSCNAHQWLTALPSPPPLVQKPERDGAGGGSAAAAARGAAAGHQPHGASEDSGAGKWLFMGCPGGILVAGNACKLCVRTPRCFACGLHCCCLPRNQPPLICSSPCLQRAKPGSRLRKMPILQGVSSVLRPGRLTLLLGPPGAGKSTLLRALSGQLKRESRLKVGHLPSSCAALCCGMLR